MRYNVRVDDREYEVEMLEVEGSTHVRVDGQEVECDLQQVNAPSLYSLLLNNRSFEILIEEREDHYAVFHRSELYEVKVQDARSLRVSRARERRLGGAHAEMEIKAPMPGLVAAVGVEVGAEVAMSQSLVVLEAMKMENDLRAPRAGTVKSVHVARGDKVSQGQVLVVLM